MSAAIDWASKALTLLVVLLAAMFALWQCLEGLFKITTIGRGFYSYCRNCHVFERWLKAMKEKEARDEEIYRKFTNQGGRNG